MRLFTSNSDTCFFFMSHRRDTFRRRRVVGCERASGYGLGKTHTARVALTRRGFVAASRFAPALLQPSDHVDISMNVSMRANISALWMMCMVYARCHPLVSLCLSFLCLPEVICRHEAIPEMITFFGSINISPPR